MKKSFFGIFAFVAIVAFSMYLTSCNSCSRGDEIVFVPETPDSTMYVRLNAVNGDSIDVELLEDGTKYTLDFAEAMKSGNVHGLLTPGDSLAVMWNLKVKSIKSSINLSELKGLWLIEGRDGDGMNLMPNGTAASVGNKDISMREWKIKNGMLIITYKEYGKNEEGEDVYKHLQDTSKILSLSKDSLHIDVNGNIYLCKRQVEIMTLSEDEIRAKTFYVPEEKKK